jgi:hypothetical protein
MQIGKEFLTELSSKRFIKISSVTVPLCTFLDGLGEPRQNGSLCHAAEQSDFRETRRSESLLYLLRNSTSAFASHIYCPIWVKLGVRDRHIMLLSICGFHENWRREGSSFLTAVYENTFMCIPQTHYTPQ